MSKAASMSARRARRLPAKVRPFRRIVSPDRAFRRDKTEGKDISCLKAYRTGAHVADLGGKSHSDEKRGAAHRLVGFHDRAQPSTTLRHDESELFLKATPGVEPQASSIASIPS